MATMPGIRSGKWMTSGASLAAAVVLLWAAVVTHLEYACTVKDTPYLGLCPAVPEDPETLKQQFRSRIARNPGDAWAWSGLLAAHRGSGDEPILKAAAVLAPNQLVVMHRRAADAFARDKAPEGLALLIEIVQNRHSAEAAKVVAQIAMTSEGMTLLKPHMKEAGRWLPRVLAAMQSMKIPLNEALPLIAGAMQHNALPDDSRRKFISSLKAGGLWLDAYGLWVANRPNGVPLLYNGSFDQALEPDGFDWEPTRSPRSRAGVIVQQQPVAKRGLVLQLEFNGRSFTAPVVRQYIFAPPGHYVLRGEYAASKLRSESGLAWNVACPVTGRQLPARGGQLAETGGIWRPVEVEFTVPPDCGPLVSIQLEPAAKHEAGAGIKGRIELDNFALEVVQN